MGYMTKFEGELRFTHDATVAQVAAINAMQGLDRRELDPPVEGNWFYFDLEPTDDLMGVKWNGAEKSYSMEQQVQYLIDEMRKKWPDFGLSGEMTAQGEDYDDRWKLSVKNGKAIKQPIKMKGKKVTCPHCEREFRVEE